MAKRKKKDWKRKFLKSLIAGSAAALIMWLFLSILYPAYLSTTIACSAQTQEELVNDSRVVAVASYDNETGGAKLTFKTESLDLETYRHERCHAMQFERGTVPTCKLGVFAWELECYTRQLYDTTWDKEFEEFINQTNVETQPPSNATNTFIIVSSQNIQTKLPLPNIFEGWTEMPSPKTFCQMPFTTNRQNYIQPNYMQEIANKIKQNTTDDLQRLQLALDYIHSKVSYEVQTRDIPLTILGVEGKGDCSDMSHLFTSITTAMGYESWNFWVKPTELNGLLDHEYSIVRLTNGSWLYVDPVAQNISYFYEYSFDLNFLELWKPYELYNNEWAFRCY